MLNQFPRFYQSPEMKYLSPVGRDVLNMIRAIVGTKKNYAIEFLKWLSPAQTESMREVLTGYTERPQSERDLISYILHPLTDGSTNSIVLYETLLLHDAFIGRTLQLENQYRFDVFARLVVGLRDNLDIPLDLSTHQKRMEAKALISFSFEVETHGAEFMRHFYNKARKLNYMRYESDALKEVVLRYADQSEKLIDIALSRETTDPELLAIIMNEENASALNSGIL
jgi:predicted CopG family antitoxin